MANASVFSQYLQPVRSVADYTADADAADMRRVQLAGAQRQNALAELVAQQQAQQMRDTAEGQSVLRRIASGWNAQTPAERRIADLRNSGRPELMASADNLEKQAAQAMDAQAKLEEARAKTAKTRAEVIDAGLSRYRAALDFVDSPQAAAQWMQAQYADPEIGGFVQSAFGPADQALSRIPTDAAGFDKWRHLSAVGLQKFQAYLLDQAKMDQTKKDADRNYQLRANNELVGADGMPNRVAIGAKSAVAKSGASTSNISVHSEKTYAGNVAEGLAKADVAIIDAGRSAPDRVNTARSIKQVLDSNKAITGTAADIRLEISKALSTAGITDPGSTTATEDLVSMLNSQTLDAIKTSGLGGGQGFTDKDRQFLQDARSGRIAINRDTLWRMADLNERAALATIKSANKVAARLKGNPTFGDVGQDLEIQAPSADSLAAAIKAEAERRAKQNRGK